MHEPVARVFIAAGQIGQIAGIGELVEVDQPTIGQATQRQTHKIGANETGSTSNQNTLHIVLLKKDYYFKPLCWSYPTVYRRNLRLSSLAPKSRFIRFDQILSAAKEKGFDCRVWVIFLTDY
jgi:hypothetical protein